MEIKGVKVIFLGKTDLLSAFRVLPLRLESFPWLILKAEDPKDGKTKYFVKKCLPFGASISCSYYQRFSNALRYILVIKVHGPSREINNYLDDFLFIAFSKAICDGMIEEFIKLCEHLGVPVAHEKTEWAGTLIVFLGILFDGKNLVLSLPIGKQIRALNLIKDAISKRKATVKYIQVLTGYLNFLTRAVFVGRTFTHRMYAKLSLAEYKKLKAYHHIKLDQEFKLDCEIWRIFSEEYKNLSLCRPMVDVNVFVSSQELFLYSDARSSI